MKWPRVTPDAIAGVLGLVLIGVGVAGAVSIWVALITVGVCLLVMSVLGG